ncbi:sigma-54-dependent transcriptional regulator [Spongiimicrobium sp. 3-5]|uniref:sigma-54-dependent transcriptional regulator n=1 Tax=Spongiimicrobium sp. 3-5 TaxID=3332596 RepID=UPI00397F2E39
MPKILIIEDDAAFCQMLQKFLTKQGYEVQASFNADSAKKIFNETTFDLVLTDLRLPNYDGIQLLTEIKDTSPTTNVIVMTGYAEVGTAVDAMKKGAYDYISKPFTPEEILMVITSSLNPKENTRAADTAFHNLGASTQKVMGLSDASKKLSEYISLVAPTNMSVLISGESGTGKEVTAKAIHDTSKRNGHNFVAVDCGAVPKEIAASEFFGHIKGSFTGAIEDKIGHFEAANGGTLFLDEIGNLTYENQVQLLRAIQERKIKRVGSTKEIHVDVRIIAATNEDLLDAVDRGSFREDLYHRLNEFFIEIPSLKERSDDLTLFADLFLKKANESLNKNVLGFSDQVLEYFNQYNWPGNLRELKNVIKRAVLLTSNDFIALDALPKEITSGSAQKTMGEDFSKAAYEKDQILKALKKTNFNKSKAAKLLQVTRKTLYNRINHYNLDF